MPIYNAYDSPQDATFFPPVSQTNRTQWLKNPPPDSSNPPKTYHATAEWGKRGMTLQELTRAFEAFNEAEERVALRFAGSEDCNRRLAEPLSEVKTVFLDLDGLKAPLRCPSSSPVSSVASLSQHKRVAHIPQVKAVNNVEEMNELGYIRINDDPTRTNISATHESHPEIKLGYLLDEDTIKLYQKRRRSLLATPSEIPTLEFKDGLEIGTSARPHSRLGFADESDVREHNGETI